MQANHSPDCKNKRADDAVNERRNSDSGQYESKHELARAPTHSHGIRTGERDNGSETRDDG